VRCSKGTYVRTLAVQIGRALEMPAHLSMLRRTQVGRYDVKDAIALDALTGSPEELRSMASAVAHLPRLEVDASGAEHVRHGRPLLVEHLRPLFEERGVTKGAALAVVREGELLAVAEATVGTEDLGSLAGSDRAVGYACVLVGR
jgi:tRNA pseudouridine55 synthase